jgi:hypothetical protein
MTQALPPNNSLSQNPPVPQRIDPKPRPQAKNLIIPAFALITGAMVGAAAPQLVGAEGLGGMFKVALLSSGAALVSYVVNRFAIEEGAELAATGYWSAGIASVGSILVVGVGLWASTYTGLTLNAVNDLKTQQHGQALTDYVTVSNETAAKALRAKPIIDGAGADFKAHIACEISDACLSRGLPGRGSVTIAIEPIALRAEEIGKQLEAGEKARAKQLQKLNKLVADYQTALGDEELNRKDKRKSLLTLDGQIKQGVSAIKEAVPLTLVRAYAGELALGLEIEGRDIATANVTQLMQRHGQNIQSALGDDGETSVSAPTFPSRAGVSSSFAHIGRFFSIAALTASVELIMPLTLWIYTFVSVLWRKYQIAPPQASAAPHPSQGSQPSQGSHPSQGTQPNVVAMGKSRRKSRRS